MKPRVRKPLVLLAAAAVFGIAGPALADGPSGSHEEDTVCDPVTGVCSEVWDNQVSCGAGTDVGGATVYAGPNGVEVCNDDADLPIQGRAIATSDDGGYIAADGDADNATEAQGWVRVDQSGVRCGDPAGSLDATHPGAGDTSEHCG